MTGIPTPAATVDSGCFYSRLSAIASALWALWCRRLQPPALSSLTALWFHYVCESVSCLLFDFCWELFSIGGFPGCSMSSTGSCWCCWHLRIRSAWVQCLWSWTYRSHSPLAALNPFAFSVWPGFPNHLSHAFIPYSCSASGTRGNPWWLAFVSQSWEPSGSLNSTAYCWLASNNSPCFSQAGVFPRFACSSRSSRCWNQEEPNYAFWPVVE